MNYDLEWSSDIQKLKDSESFGPCQPARTAQADMGRYFSQLQGV